ncbi:phosphoglycolate phosphatase [Salinibaculum rarum]|uniref:phosphoglycolate phosphatase n=1 Tax=Salinibaculum rarum TaxID=3058903 RepID=UPI00265E86A7|nr:phosphoglycolate phosphatase [Salinibaculum sp. KK48]
MDTPSVPDDAPPLAVDIDGTLTDDQRALDPRVIPVLRAWPAPVVVATGKSMPYPVALCEFLAIDQLVVAENGGVVVAGRDTVRIEGDREGANAVAAAYRDAGYGLGWGEADLVNRWRETELAVAREMPLEPLVEIASEHGLDVVDTGYAYHVKSPSVDKGSGLDVVAAELNLRSEAFLAVGDSENDVPTFEVAGRSVAVANADDLALAAADHVTAASFADGFLEAVERFAAP